MSNSGRVSKTQLEAWLRSGDLDRLVSAARAAPGRILRHVLGRLFTDDRAERERALSALGALVATPGLLTDQAVLDLLRRFHWSLNDESGAVPFGAPEALGEILAVRAEYRATWLPILCGFLTEEDTLQTGDIERGLLWALARIGPEVLTHVPDILPVVQAMAKRHEDPGTRTVAAHTAETLLGT